MSAYDQHQEQYSPASVAVVGMALRFPGANSPQELWDVLLSRRETITRFTPDDYDPTVTEAIHRHDDYVPARGVLADIDKFDAAYFGLTPLEAKILDPQHRIFLQTAVHALEDAGLDPARFPDLIGVYAGVGPNTYFAHHVSTNQALMRGIGDYAALTLAEKDYLCTRLSFLLNLRGPSFCVSTACSTSLVSVCEAVSHLLAYRCDAAIAGGVSITTPQKMGYQWEEGHILSKAGHCRPFDSRSDGTVPSSGAGVVVLKRLEDAMENGDRVYAIIRGTGLNNDGSNKIGFTAPGVETQLEAIMMAQAEAEVDPASISMIEAHGTGTRLGDYIETSALSRAFEGVDDQSIALGSIKSNLGHMDSAAGIGGMIKAVLSLYHGIIPPTAHFEEPDPRLELETSPFFIPQEPVPFPAGPTPARVGVTSLGLGGTNAHVILEAAPQQAASAPTVRPVIIQLSAKDPEALKRGQEELAARLAGKPEINIADVAHTLHEGRTQLPLRSTVVAETMAEATEQLHYLTAHRNHSKPAKPHELVFLFPGQGVQYAGMGKTLYEREPAFTKAMDRCAEILQPQLGFDVRKLLFAEIDGSDDKLRQTRYTQPVLVAFGCALSKLWRSYDIIPSAMIGLSLGEYVAAYVSGVFSLQDVLEVVVERGRLLQEMEPGSMLSVPMPYQSIRPLLPPELVVSGINSPRLCTVSGPTPAIEAFKRLLSEQDVSATIIKTSHAFHTPMMAPAVPEFTRVIKRITMNAPRIPFVSTLSGDWITAEEATSPLHWAGQIEQPVQFSRAVKQLVNEEPKLFLEVGPRGSATILVRQHLGSQSPHATVATLPHPRQDEEHQFLTAVGQLWENGAEPRIVTEGRIVSLPGYAFAPTSHWAPAMRCSFQGDAPVLDSAVEENEDVPTTEEAISEEERFLTAAWKEVLGLETVTPEDNFFDLGGHSLIAVKLLTKVRKHFNVELPLTTLVEHPTIRDMADHLQTLQPDKAHESKQPSVLVDNWTPLVPLNAHNGHRPLFCVAGVGGHVMELKSLTKYLGDDISFYGLEARGVAGHEPHTSVEDMANENIAAIRTRQAQGPYALAGYSAGGVVAFEMARRLCEEGENVSLLAFLDSGSPTLPRRTQAELRACQLCRLARSPKQFCNDLWKRHFGPKLEQRYMKIKLAVEQAVRRYHPSPYPGDAHLFKTHKDMCTGDIRWTVDAFNGWRDLITGQIVVHTIPGDHFSMVQEQDNARELAIQLKDAFEHPSSTR